MAGSAPQSERSWPCCGRVLLPILVNAFFAIVVALCGLLLGYHLGLSALVGFGSIAAVQVSYLALGLTLDLLPLKQCYATSTGRNRTTTAHRTRSTVRLATRNGQLGITTPSCLKRMPASPGQRTPSTGVTACRNSRWYVMTPAWMLFALAENHAVSSNEPKSS